MTGYADLDIVMNAVNRGAVFKFITKPWSAEHLRTTIHEAFGHYLQYTGSAPDRTFDASSGLMRTQTDLVH
jgi:FixJ family two-component response regulator